MKVLGIIPCCGFGTRMHMSKDQSKELLPDPYTGSPIIEWHIHNLKRHNIEPFIVTRAEKKDLIQYCKDKGLRYVVMSPGEEWQHTVFNSHPFWEDYNILVFPDSRFFPTFSLHDIKNALKYGFDFGLGTFPVSDSSKWCCVTNDGIYEKKQDLQGPHLAIGIFGFTRIGGLKLFEGLKTHKEYKFDIVAQHKTSNLTMFKDLTRDGKIEKY